MFRKLQDKDSTQLQKAIDAVQANVSGKTVTAKTSKAALGLESAGISESDRSDLVGAFNQLSVGLETIGLELFGKQVNSASRDAAAVAGILAGDANGFFKASIRDAKADSPFEFISSATAQADSLSQRVGMEAYDNRENANIAEYSMVYNLMASMQDEFGEALYPLITVPPDQIGFKVRAKVAMVYSEVSRNVSGAVDNFNRKNIIRAYADPTIISNDMTNVIPVYRPQSATFFTPTTQIPAYDVLQGNFKVPTAPLAIGATFSLLAISQTDVMLLNGTNDQTDALDPAVRLSKLYIQFVSAPVAGVSTTDIVAFDVSQQPYNNFQTAIQNNSRKMLLNFETTSILVDAATVDYKAGALVALAPVVTGKYTVRLRSTVTGSTVLDTSTTTVSAPVLEVYSINDQFGASVDMTIGAGLAIAALFANMTVIGYDLQAFRTNTNNRIRGQLIDIAEVTQSYNVPLRSPISALRPLNSPEQTDATYLQGLIGSTKARLYNQAVTNLFEQDAALSSYVKAPATIGDLEGNYAPDTMGIGRFFVMPHYSTESIDMSISVDSIKSSDRMDDVRATLVNKIRDHVYRAYVQSQYQAASSFINGGPSTIPTVVIATDPVLANYLTVVGDLRTLGSQFETKIVSSLDTRMTGVMFITFGIFDSKRNEEPNPLNWGNLAWSPELTMTLQATRNGAVNKEMRVQPRFLFVNNCPILIRLNVTNIPMTLAKTPINTHAV